MSGLHKVRIKLDVQGRGEVYVDDLRIKGLRSISVDSEQGAPTRVRLELLSEVDADLGAETVG